VNLMEIQLFGFTEQLLLMEKTIRFNILTYHLFLL